MLSYSAHVIYNKTFETEEDLLAFFGLLMIVTNVAAMFFQFFITNRVMVWVGVRRTKFIYPITTILSFILLLVQPGFIAAVFASINRDTFMPAFRVPVRQMFFNVLPEYMKGRARAITVAIITPMALFICGLLILAIQRYGNLSVLLIIGLVLSIVYLYFSVRMGKSYVSTLIDSMKEKLFLPTYSSSVLKDKNIALLEALSRGLASSNDLVSLSYAKALVLAYPDKAVDLLLERVRNAKIPAADQMLALVRTAVGKMM